MENHESHEFHEFKSLAKKKDDNQNRRKEFVKFAFYSWFRFQLIFVVPNLIREIRVIRG